MFPLAMLSRAQAEPAPLTHDLSKQFDLELKPTQWLREDSERTEWMTELLVSGRSDHWSGLPNLVSSQKSRLMD